MTTEALNKGDYPPSSREDKSHYLVITCDDFGYSTERDRGIIKCFRESAISTASFLVDGVHAKEGADWSNQEGLPLGLHLNLTEGTPLTDKDSCHSLVDKDGLFLGKMSFRKRIKDGKIHFSQVQLEIENQIKRFKELLGYFPYHVDGHQHVHVIPGVAEVFAEVLFSNGIKVTRLPIERCIDDCDWLEPGTMTFYKEVISNSTSCQPIFHNYDLKFTDTFSGLSTCSVEMTMLRLKRTLDIAFSQSKELANEDRAVSMATEHLAQPIRTCELMVHAGYCTENVGGCGAGPDAFSQSKAREQEMSTILSQEFKNYLTEHKITLCNFKDIFSK